jgi:hypothetical protein
VGGIIKEKDITDTNQMRSPDLEEAHPGCELD